MRIRTRELLLHPIALVALVVLVANDHWLKAAHPSWLTGKLSDAAGLAVFPLLLLVVVDRWAPRAWRTVAGTIVLTALGFALVKTCPPATAMYRVMLGLLQWPLHAVAAIIDGAVVGRPVAVEAVTDPGDLLALPFTALAAVVAWRGGYLDARVGNLPLGRAVHSCYNR
jgi:hypothetical protein